MISTIIVRYRLLLENRKFEEWKEKMDAEIRHADGFLDKTDLPLIPDEPYHSVILRFDSKANAEAWQNAPRRKTLLQEMDGSDAGRQEILHANTTFWFGVSPEKNRKKWKQVAVSFLAVYPLTQVVPGLVQLVLNELEIESVLLSGMLNGMIISSCMVYLCMPLALEFFKRWLNS